MQFSYLWKAPSKESANLFSILLSIGDRITRTALKKCEEHDVEGELRGNHGKQRKLF